MDQNLKDAKTNLHEAKTDIKESISGHYDSAKSAVNEHVDDMTDKTKEVIVDVAQAVKKAADAVVGKLSKDDEKITTTTTKVTKE
jgi:uncharacterized protein YjbJ (UPF0337 family)